jgi:predicted Zn-dependent protease
VQLGESQRAYEDLEAALRLDPFSPYRSLMLCGMGVARFGQGRFREAVPLLKQAVQLQPAFALAYMFLAAGQGHLGEIGAAQDALARFKSLSATANVGAATWPELAARKLLVEGIALVDGASVAESPAAD